MEHVLQVSNVSKIYNNTCKALNNINFTIERGEFVAIMGPSGAGKSTLLNVLATIDRVSEGQILLENEDLTKLNDMQLSDYRRNHLGFIFQDYHLLDSLTVRENILLPLAVAKTPTKIIGQKVQQIAETFGIETLLEQYPYQISGGQKQRTAAARALVSEPKLIFADEPTGALDSKSATDLLTTMSRLNVERNATIMMVTHDAYAASFCRRIIFIRDGELSKEMFKGNKTREQFLKDILDELAITGGVNV